MTPELERMLREENLCYITTYDAARKPGTVEIWFVYEQGMLYILTGASSVRVRKLRVTPRARVAIGRWKGPAVEGPARLADEATVRRMVPLLSKKYDDYWGPVDQFTRRHLGTRPSRVLLEVVPTA